MRDVLALILGGGRGTRLFPLTQHRSKPAVPIGGKYRLIDVPISNCLHAELRRILVLTQFNSASLNRHVTTTYRMDLFSRGFVEILAAEQTLESSDWYQGTADAVRKARRHFTQHEASHYLILAGDHLYRMDYAELVGAHVATGADLTVAALPVSAAEATAMGIFRFGPDGCITGFEEKPSGERLAAIGRSTAPDAPAELQADAARPFIASMGIYLFARDALLDLLDAEEGDDFGRSLIPAALARYRVAVFLHRGYWADVGTIEAFYDANILLTAPDAPFSFYDPQRPMFTHPRFLPPSKAIGCSLHHALVAEGSLLDRCRIEHSVVGIRQQVGAGAEISRAVLLGADFYETAPPPGCNVPLGIGRRAVLDRVIVDKNARIGDGARLVNERGVEHEDGPNYFIRAGILIVPKGATIPPHTVI